MSALLAPWAERRLQREKAASQVILALPVCSRISEGLFRKSRSETEDLDLVYLSDIASIEIHVLPSSMKGIQQGVH